MCAGNARRGDPQGVADVGQLLEYAAHASETWTAEDVKAWAVRHEAGVQHQGRSGGSFSPHHLGTGAAVIVSANSWAVAGHGA